MAFEIDRSLDWSEQFIEHGFCVIKEAVSRDFCEFAIHAITSDLGTQLRTVDWDTESLDQGLVKEIRNPAGQSENLKTALESVYDQTYFVELVTEMLAPDKFVRDKRFAHCFISLREPGDVCIEDRQLAPYGHIDYVNCHIPMFGNGFSCDLVLFHYLVGHAGNQNMSQNRAPRVAIQCHISGDMWHNGVDPSDPNLSIWMRSGAHNGTIDLPYDDYEMAKSFFPAGFAVEVDPGWLLKPKDLT